MPKLKFKKKAVRFLFPVLLAIIFKIFLLPLYGCGDDDNQRNAIEYQREDEERKRREYRQKIYGYGKKPKELKAKTYTPDDLFQKPTGEKK